MCMNALLKPRTLPAKVRPGQFIIVIPDEYSERTPITVADWDMEKGTITFIFLDIGSSTERLMELNAGDEIYSLTGPLGKAFRYGKIRQGSPCGGLLRDRGDISLLPGRCKEIGNRVVCYSEARSNFLLYWNEKLEEISDEVRYATADGSLGFKGHAHDQLEQTCRSGIKYDRGHRSRMYLYDVPDIPGDQAF